MTLEGRTNFHPLGMRETCDSFNSFTVAFMRCLTLVLTLGR
jgi:hypothetical protein